MDTQKVDMFLMTSAKFFEPHQINIIREQLLKMDDAKSPLLYSLGLKDPTTMIIVSLIGGHFGIDRFMIGEVGLGIAKLLTCGGLGIWSIVDWFIIMGQTREVNFRKIQQVIY